MKCSIDNNNTIVIAAEQPTHYWNKAICTTVKKLNQSLGSPYVHVGMATYVLFVIREPSDKWYGAISTIK